ncbi:ABC transporter ATP-binding protein [Emticicia sp. BO119]|uniref:ABC transporter ATP-binding protein n=1 Tax=Emticicia sp. BO119 TaxID=2757768 RepID=UPI0015F09E6D|nr:ABC transporter ATP-binding protein [Emticicia sp. BO119]MBA4852251.1 ABC transporter ATP-binding protein [Emticicia sp. BO119]
MSLLRIQNLLKSFGDKKAVNHISFTLEKGEILAILGESGSGKTTLLHLIGAFQEPDEGTLLLENKRITPPSEKLIAGHPDIKLVRQDYGLFPNISIRENIAYELRYYEETYRNKRVDKLLKLSGLDKVHTHLPREVSGGEQQRAVIVKAIAEQPRLLLLDEPFSHLDAVNKRKLKAEILKLIKAEEVSCIFVTHDVSDAYGMADHLAIMRKGKMLQMDAPQKVYQNPLNQYVAEITGEVNIVSKEWLTTIGFLDTSIVFIRPEQIFVSPSSEIKAEIQSLKFLGSYYEVLIRIGAQELKMFSFEALKLGEEIGIDIRY